MRHVRPEVTNGGCPTLLLKYDFPWWSKAQSTVPHLHSNAFKWCSEYRSADHRDHTFWKSDFFTAAFANSVLLFVRSTSVGGFSFWWRRDLCIRLSVSSFCKAWYTVIDTNVYRLCGRRLQCCQGSDCQGCGSCSTASRCICFPAIFQSGNVGLVAPIAFSTSTILSSQLSLSDYFPGFTRHQTDASTIDGSMLHYFR